MTTLSVAVGNLDMHAKNISVLHLSDGAARLAPMYDVVPQVHQGISTAFAFSINGVFEHADITARDLADEGMKWGVRDAANIVAQTITAIRAFVETESPAPGAFHGLVADIQRFCANLENGQDTGAEPRTRGQSSDARLKPVRGASGGWGGPVRP
jgi:serine/threonine-protein kinase HipA